MHRESTVSFKPPRSIPRAKWSQGLSALDKLWKRGLFPNELERHYFLHWFVVYDGNILRTADTLQIHRNTIQGHFLSLGYSKKSVKLRHSWREIQEKYPKDSFEKNFLRFYQKFGKKPSFTPEENNALVGLWQTRFSFKTLVSHYLLWSIRSGKSRDWVQKQLDYSYRHRARLLSQLVKSKTRDGFWLSPLKPSPREIDTPRYQKILRKKGL